MGHERDDILLDSMYFVGRAGIRHHYGIEINQALALHTQLAGRDAAIGGEAFVFRWERAAIAGEILEVLVIGCYHPRTIGVTLAHGRRSEQRLEDYSKRSLTGIGHGTIIVVSKDVLDDFADVVLDTTDRQDRSTICCHDRVKDVVGKPTGTG